MGIALGAVGMAGCAVACMFGMPAVGSVIGRIRRGAPGDGS
jgi:hypothetical protein